MSPRDNKSRFSAKHELDQGRLDIPDDALTFYSNYTKEKNLETLRQKIYSVQDILAARYHVYRCMAKASFIKPRIPDSVIPSLESNSKILEIGACFGTDVRNMIQAGLKPENIIATDITSGYWQLGEQLFGDKLSVETIWTDLGCPESDVDPRISKLYNGQDLVLALAVFHVLNQKQVDQMIKRIFKLLKPGGRLVSSQACAGNHAEGFWRSQDGVVDEERWLHSPESMEAALREVGFSQVQISISETWDTANFSTQTTGSATYLLSVDARK